MAKPERLDVLLQVTSPREWLLLLGVGVVVVLSLLWTLFSEFERALESNGFVLLPGQRQVVASMESGRIVELLVPVGSPVVEGQAILRFSPSGLDLESAAARAELDRLEQVAMQSLDKIERNEADIESAAGSIRDAIAVLSGIRESGTLISSPASGVLSHYFGGAGQHVLGGQPVAEIRATTQEEKPVVIVALKTEEAGMVEAGMEARVAIDSGGAEGTTFDAIVLGPAEQDFAPESVPAAGNLAMNDGSELVLLRLLQQPGDSLRDGAPCRARIVLSRERPIKLLVS